jgi:hypothetical protein
MAGRMVDVFARGSGSAVADALAPAIEKVKQFRAEKIAGPWDLVAEVLRSVDVALRTRDVAAFTELAKTARACFEKFFIAVAVDSTGDSTVAHFTLDLMDPTRRKKHQRLETLAAFLGATSKSNNDVRLQVYQAAQLLPQICPELPFKYKADDVVLFRPHPFGESAEDVRDRISRLVQQGELPLKAERRLGAFLARKTVMKLPRCGDGRGIVRAGARFCGVPEREIRGLFAGRYAARYRARKQSRRPPEV